MADVRLSFEERTYEHTWITMCQARGPIEFPACSPDITTLDFFLWGTVKDEVYKCKPRHLDTLWNKIQAVGAEIPEDTLVRCTESVLTRTNAEGHHWFNVNEKIRNILPMIYDYFFTISSSLFDIQTVHIEINVYPKYCIRYTDYEEVETITRQYLLKEVLTANSQICSAHLENSGNTGIISFKGCHIDESSNKTVCDDIKENVVWLTGVNIAAIIASTLILGLIFILILLSPT
uniref:Uncharacterized protein n=1 Tax=Biomphalaria glabrata TaxID=6526 RepID=A0A2C9LTY0_BIOGL